MKKINYATIGEELIYQRLPNGLDVFAIPKREFMTSYAFFATNYGSVDTSFTLGGKKLGTPAGVAHFLEHKMFDTEDGNALQKLSQNGASPNAFTSFGITAYHFESPVNFEKNLEILLDFVSVPYFTEASVNNEQGIISQEIRMYEDNPNWRVFENLFRGLFEVHPVRVNIAGTVESIAEITPEVLYDCHKGFYCPSNMTLVVAGNLDAERVCETAQRILPKEPGQAADRDYGNEDFSKAFSTRTEQRMQVAKPLFMLGYKAYPPQPGRESMRREVLGELALKCLAGPSTALYARLYSEGLINRSFDCEYNSFPGGGCLVFGGESHDPDKVADEVAAEAERVMKEGFDAGLFDRVKKAATGSRINDLNFLERICYGQAYAHFQKANYFEFPEIYESISREDAEGFIREFMKPELKSLSVINSL